VNKYPIASKCRQKKKQWMQELEFRSMEISTKNDALKITIQELQNQIDELKNQLYTHQNCEW